MVYYWGKLSVVVVKCSYFTQGSTITLPI